MTGTSYKGKLMRYVRIFLIVLIVATLAFTFFQSSKSKEESQETSDNVGQMIEPIISSDTPIGDYVHTNLRKIAHFVEFFMLGAEVALYIVLFCAKIKYAAFSLLVAPIVALFDETIQIFSDRGPSISDVWLDVLGFFSAALIVYAVGFLIIKYRSSSSADDGNNLSGEK